MPAQIPSLFKFTPAVRNYVWGGRALLSLTSAGATADDVPIAEVWSIHADNRVADGPFAGWTLAQLTAQYPAEVLGANSIEAGTARFPLLIKLLDCANWLSLQVHPNDRMARQLEGPQFVGKTEAWHILDARHDSQLIAGIKPGAPLEKLHAAIGNAAILDLTERHHVQPNDTVYMPAGTIHALGPGLLVYEVQQTSDLTYRVFDWDRPQANGRALHIEKSIAAINPDLQGRIIRWKDAGNVAPLIQCPYFLLEIISAPVQRDTHKRSFHALTVTEGQALVSTLKGAITLRQFDTVLVPASCESYQLEGNFRILCSSAPGGWDEESTQGDHRAYAE